MAAGILNTPFVPTFRPCIAHRPANSRAITLTMRISAQSSETETVAPAASSTAPLPSISPPPNFEPPQPKRFKARSDKRKDVLGASLAILFRLGTGVFASGYSATFVPKDQIPSDKYSFLEIAGFKMKESSKLGLRPEKPIEIYEYESSPYCRKVREIVAILDLEVLYYPCPADGPNFRPKVAQMGGKKQFPYMVDPNTGVDMYDSDEIIRYLVWKYGNGHVPLKLSLGPLTTLTEALALIGRWGKGSSYTPAKLPPKPLEIWAYEASPFCKIVRETLVELEIPHILHSCARGSPKRQALFERVGHFQVPYLEDPNTGVQMFESAEIIEYLMATYALVRH